MFLLSLCAGLCRNEIDKLEWSAFDFGRHTVRIETTEFLHSKIKESTGEVEIDPEVTAIFERYCGEATGRFVIESDRMPILEATYSAYRCKKVFGGLTDWLRGKGDDAQKPLHELRKEFGSTIANEHGILPRRVLYDTPTSDHHPALCRQQAANNSEIWPSLWQSRGGGFISGALRVMRSITAPLHGRLDAFKVN